MDIIIKVLELKNKKVKVVAQRKLYSKAKSELVHSNQMLSTVIYSAVKKNSLVPIEPLCTYYFPDMEDGRSGLRLSIICKYRHPRIIRLLLKLFA